MSNDIEFVDGLICKPPHENAPDYVKMKISIKRKDLGNWLRAKQDDWINVEVKVSRAGKWYAAVDQWKPDEGRQQGESRAGSGGTTTGPRNSEPPQGDFEDPIPF